MNISVHGKYPAHRKCPAAARVGIIPVLPTADKIQSKYHAAARAGINPAPTTDACNTLIINVLPTRSLHHKHIVNVIPLQGAERQALVSPPSTSKKRWSFAGADRQALVSPPSTGMKRWSFAGANRRSSWPFGRSQDRIFVALVCFEDFPLWQRQDPTEEV